MATLALLSVGVLALLVFVLFGALVELYRDVRQLRDAAGILDRPLSLDIGLVVNTRPTTHGLPEELDGAVSALVLFLSDTCATCRVLAGALDRAVPAGLWLVLEARSPQSAAAFLATYGLTPKALDARVLVDVSGEIAGRIGLDTTPVAFRVDHGRLTSATTVPSVRYLTSILPTPVRLKRERSEEWRHSWSRNASSPPPLVHQDHGSLSGS